MVKHELPRDNAEFGYRERLLELPDLLNIPGEKRQNIYDGWIMPFENAVGEAVESQLVMRTWLRELPGHPSAAGVIYAMGVEVHEGNLNKTPHLIAIPIDQVDLTKLKGVVGGDQVKFEMQAEMVRAKLQEKLLSPTEYRQTSKSEEVPLPITNLNILNGGWGNRPEVWNEQINAVIDAFANVDNIPDGVRVTDQIFLAQGPLGAHKSTPTGDSWRTITQEDIPVQPVAALRGLIRDLVNGKEDVESEAQKNLLQKVTNVFGHSMHGLGLLFNLTGENETLLKLLNQAENRYAKFHVMNTVVCGSDADKQHDEMLRMRTLIGNTMAVKASQSVPLLATDAGFVVQQSGWLMQSEFIGKVAHLLKIDVGMIKGFLGQMGETLIPLLSHVNQIINDPRQTMMDNKLLKAVGFVIKSSAHKVKLTELIKAGRLTMWMGDRDAIVTPEEEWLLAYWLGINKYIETTNHYAEKEVMGAFLPAMLAPVGVEMGDLSERMPGIFKPIPDYTVVKQRIIDRKWGFTGWVRKLGKRSK